MLSTIGYERADLDDFVATLRASEVDVLVDIRDRAQSRRPGFSKTALASALSDAGIDYLHLRELGDPKEGREAARRGDFAAFRKVFGRVMKSAAAVEALATIEDLAKTQKVCLMCFERDQKTCHRKIVSDHLENSLNCKTLHMGVKKGAGKIRAAA